MNTSQLSNSHQKPLWQEWPGRPVPLRKAQIISRTLGSFFELAAAIYFTWLCSNWPDRFITAAAGFSAILIGFIIDTYEAYMLAGHERDFPINPGAICIDLLVITVGFVGYWLIAFVDHKSEALDNPAWNANMGRAGALLIVTLIAHGLFLLLGVVGIYLSSRGKHQHNGGRRVRVGANETQLGDLSTYM